MAWDEALFGLVFKTVRRWRVGHAADEPNAVPLGPLKDRLRVVASAQAGRPLLVQEAEGHGGLASAALLLPARVGVSPDPAVNLGVYLWRVVHAGAVARMAKDVGRGPRGLLWVTPRVLRHCEDECPRAMDWFRAAAPWVRRAEAPTVASSPWDILAALVLGASVEDLTGTVGAAELAWACVALDASRVGAAVPALPNAPRRGWSEDRAGLMWGRGLPWPSGSSVGAERCAPGEGASGTERQGRAREHVQVMGLPDEPEQESPLVHSFEKVHTAEEYQGGRKRVDGEDDMAEQADALDELDLRKVVRSRQRTRSVYRADVLMEPSGGGAAAPADAGGLPYDEWDASSGSYRRAWCRLFESWGDSAGVLETRAWSAKLLRDHKDAVQQVQRTLARIRLQRRWRGRLADGPDVDLDALVDRHAALAAGHTPEDRLHGARLRHARNVAVLVLLDTSLSTDSYVEGRRVLDVARTSIVVLGQALEALAIPVAVAGFQSHTRTDCRYHALKGFSESWEAAHRRLLPLVPDGYTRMGPALRHATKLLSRQGAQRKLLIMLTDGKPTDHDHYEGRHGIEDVRQAVREADALGVRVFGLAVDSAARRHLPRLLGRGNYRVLPHPAALAGALAALHGRLLA